MFEIWDESYCALHQELMKLKDWLNVHKSKCWPLDSWSLLPQTHTQIHIICQNVTENVIENVIVSVSRISSILSHTGFCSYPYQDIALNSIHCVQSNWILKITSRPIITLARHQKYYLTTLVLSVFVPVRASGPNKVGVKRCVIGSKNVRILSVYTFRLGRWQERFPPRDRMDNRAAKKNWCREEEEKDWSGREGVWEGFHQYVEFGMIRVHSVHLECSFTGS